MMLERTRKQAKRQPMAAASWCILVNLVNLVKRGVEQGFSHLSYTSIPGSTRELANPEVDL
jgi:hypothetical protein